MSDPNPMRQWDTYAERLRVQLPAAPEPLTNAYMKWAPWVAIVFGALGLLLTLGGLFLGAILGPFLVLAGLEGVSAGAMALLALVAMGIGAALEVVGGYLMLQRSATGWWLLAIGLILSALHSIFAANILGLMFVVAVAYIHLLVKPNYR